MQVFAPLKYLGLPLRTASLLVIVIFSVFLTLAKHAGIFGVPMLVIIGSWFFKYAFVLLDAVIDGHREPPVLSAEMVNPVEQRPLGTFLLLIVLYAATSAVQPLLGDLCTTILRVALLALVPAMIAAMSVTGKFLEALNPVAVFGAIARIPVAYLSLLIIIAALWFIPVATWLHFSSAGAATQMPGMNWFMPFAALQAGATSGITGIFGLMLFMYLWLAMFACIGGQIFEHRMELDVDAAYSPERLAAKASAELEKHRDKLIDRIFAEVRGNAFANASASVRRMIEESSTPLEECRWLYARAAQWPDQRLAVYLAQLTLPRLLKVRASGEALQILRERLQHDANFRPDTAGVLLQMAALARDAGDRPSARCLLQNFEQYFPSDPMLSLVEQMRDDLR